MRVGCLLMVVGAWACAVGAAVVAEAHLQLVNSRTEVGTMAEVAALGERL